MKPRGMQSPWVKHKPWSWAKERLPASRAAEGEKAVRSDLEAEFPERPRKFT